jgi:hypothetical protein
VRASVELLTSANSSRSARFAILPVGKRGNSLRNSIRFGILLTATSAIRG